MDVLLLCIQINIQYLTMSFVFQPHSSLNLPKDNLAKDKSNRPIWFGFNMAHWQQPYTIKQHAYVNISK